MRNIATSLIVTVNGMICYFCPDLNIRSAGIRILYRHVDILSRHGISAAILHTDPSFRMSDALAVPIRFISEAFSTLGPQDILVIPEGFTDLMQKAAGVRRFAIALNWDYVFDDPRKQTDWKGLGIERILTHSPAMGGMLQWCMKLPTHVFGWGINGSLYYPPVETKRRELVFITRKQDRAAGLFRILRNRNPQFGQEFTWTGAHDLSEQEYASVVRRSAIFLNLSRAEGLPCSMLEAMRCGTLVAGYGSIGGSRELIGNGPRQNCIRVETMDYPSLAMQLEPVLADLLQDRNDRIATILSNASLFSQQYTQDAEEQSVLELWQQIPGGAPGHP